MPAVTFVTMRDAQGARRWEMRVNGRAMAYWYSREEYEKASLYLERKFRSTGTRVTYSVED